MTGDASGRAAHSARLYDLLLANDFVGLETLFHAFFATSKDIAGYEGFYASGSRPAASSLESSSGEGTSPPHTSPGTRSTTASSQRSRNRS